MRKTLTIAFLMILLSSTVVKAQNALNRSQSEHLKYIQVEDVDMLFELLEDKSVTTKLKSKGMARLGSIYREHPKELEKNADRVLNLITEIRDQHNKQANDEDDELRRECVLALGIFASGSKAPQAIEEISKSLNDDPAYTVNSSAAHILREFKNNSSEANNVLIKKLDSFLKKTVLTENDLKTTFTVISSMGTLGQKRSFIPLMRVLQSGFPVYIKKAAEEAIGSIDWEK